MDQLLAWLCPWNSDKGAKQSISSAKSRSRPPQRCTHNNNKLLLKQKKIKHIIREGCTCMWINWQEVLKYSLEEP